MENPMHTPIRRSLALAGLLLVPALAGAETYATLVPAQSTLRFSYSQMGVTLDGAFGQFEAQVSYDPAQPAAARTVVTVPLKSIDTGSEEGDDEVQGSDWFDAAAHPLARFESSSVKPGAAGALEVSGTLSIKGKSRPLTVPVKVVEADGRATFTGSFQINRTDFGIGTGMWAKDDVVAHPITVSFELVAKPATP
jgi:polyisoprenoid-binding protein YceI